MVPRSAFLDIILSGQRRSIKHSRNSMHRLHPITTLLLGIVPPVNTSDLKPWLKWVKAHQAYSRRLPDAPCSDRPFKYPPGLSSDALLKVKLLVGQVRKSNHQALKTSKKLGEWLRTTKPPEVSLFFLSCLFISAPPRPTSSARACACAPDGRRFHMWPNKIHPRAQFDRRRGGL